MAPVDRSSSSVSPAGFLDQRLRAFGLVLLLALASSPAATPTVNSASPFGVVCPWPELRGSGIKWCRIGAGATPFPNWPDIEKTEGTLDWTPVDRELRDLEDPLDLSLLPIFGYTPKWASRAPEDKDFQFSMSPRFTPINGGASSTTLT